MKLCNIFISFVLWIGKLFKEINIDWEIYTKLLFPSTLILFKFKLLFGSISIKLVRFIIEFLFSNDKFDLYGNSVIPKFALNLH